MRRAGSRAGGTPPPVSSPAGAFESRPSGGSVTAFRRVSEGGSDDAHRPGGRAGGPGGPDGHSYVTSAPVKSQVLPYGPTGDSFSGSLPVLLPVKRTQVSIFFLLSPRTRTLRRAAVSP